MTNNIQKNVWRLKANDQGKLFIQKFYKLFDYYADKYYVCNFVFYVTDK